MELEETPTIVFGPIQKCALVLGAQHYTIEFKEGENHAYVDALSRLPLPTSNKDQPRHAEVIYLMKYLDTSPVLSAQIRVRIDRDAVFNQINTIESLSCLT